MLSISNNCIPRWSSMSLKVKCLSFCGVLSSPDIHVHTICQQTKYQLKDLNQLMSHYSGEEDTYDVYSEVVGLAGRWSNMCLALRLLPSDQSTIAAAHPRNPHDCLQAVVVQWLQKGYNYQRYGPPTWRMLVEAVGDPAGGNNNTLAETLAKKHPGM